VGEAVRLVVEDDNVGATLLDAVVVEDASFDDWA
tara:strand:- start:435 stop:536 length:102 start_codon:yes stop_codon:yes gene_type:complete